MDFTSDDQDAASQLEFILNGLPFNKNITFIYDGWVLEDGTCNNDKAESPVYLLPVKRSNNIIHASFKIDDKLFEKPIGFFDETPVNSKNAYIKYHRLNANCKISMDHWASDGTIYLPFNLTPFSKKIKLHDNKTESPVQVYG